MSRLTIADRELILDEAKTVLSYGPHLPLVEKLERLRRDIIHDPLRAAIWEYSYLEWIGPFPLDMKGLIENSWELFSVSRSASGATCGYFKRLKQ